MPFEIGHQVQLKSGGAIMIVDDVSESHVFCTWYADGGERSREWIRESDLRVALKPDWQSYPDFDPTEDPF